jgi:hypothetical protein
MRKLICLIVCLIAAMICLALPVNAQDPEKPEYDPNTILIGAVINAENVGNYQISGAFRKQLSGSLFSFTFYDVSGISLYPFSTVNMQYSGKQALTMPLYKPAKWVSLWVMGEAGILGTESVATGSTFGGGGYADFRFGKNFHIIAMPKAVKNTISGTVFEFRTYGGIGW